MAYKVFANGFPLQASELNNFLMNQTVMVFASSAERASTLTAPTEGMITYLQDTNALESYNGAAWIAVGVDTNLNNVLITAPRETTNIQADATGGTENFNLFSGAHMFHTLNAASNFTLNIRSSATVALNTTMSVGETTTAVFSVTQGSTAFFMTALTIDGNAQTVRWQGGAAPTTGNASSIDVYSFVITKTASATFTVLGALTRFA